jgi:putative NADH-flavin reductase
VAGHVRFELRNVVANYPFESSRGFPRSEPNSGHGDYSRLSCAVGQMQLGSSGRTNQAFLRGVGHGAASLPFCGRVRGVRSQRPAHLAVWLFASHMTMSQTSSALEHDAVATLLIIGASRGIGFETVKSALEAGHSVRALARSARRIAIDHPKLEKVAGDALEAGAVKRALSGVDLVIQSLGVPAGPEIILKPTRFFSKATRVLVAAMEEAQVRRLISVTGFGAGDSRGCGGFFYNAAFHLLLGRVYDDKDVQEWIIRRSKLDWVIVRPVILTDGRKTNVYRALVDPRDWTCGFISRADVADFLVKQIDDDAFLHKTPVLTSSLLTSRSGSRRPPRCRAA